MVPKQSLGHVLCQEQQRRLARRSQSTPVPSQARAHVDAGSERDPRAQPRSRHQPRRRQSAGLRMVASELPDDSGSRCRWRGGGRWPQRHTVQGRRPRDRVRRRNGLETQPGQRLSTVHDPPDQHGHADPGQPQLRKSHSDPAGLVDSFVRSIPRLAPPLAIPDLTGSKAHGQDLAGLGRRVQRGQQRDPARRRGGVRGHRHRVPEELWAGQISRRNRGVRLQQSDRAGGLVGRVQGPHLRGSV